MTAGFRIVNFRWGTPSTTVVAISARPPATSSRCIAACTAVHSSSDSPSARTRNSTVTSVGSSSTANIGRARRIPHACRVRSRAPANRDATASAPCSRSVSHSLSESNRRLACSDRSAKFGWTLSSGFR